MGTSNLNPKKTSFSSTIWVTCVFFSWPTNHCRRIPETDFLCCTAPVLPGELGVSLLVVPQIDTEVDPHSKRRHRATLYSG